jgi:hypothetical protein
LLILSIKLWTKLKYLKFKWSGQALSI